MNSLLQRIVAASRQRPLAAAPEGPLPARQRFAEALRSDGALRGRERLALIAEWKRRSPSAGRLDEQRDCAAQLRDYAVGGAAALSIVTEPTEFGGTLADLHTAARVTRLPLLRKDFLVRPEQVVESAAHGAGAVLLIVRCLSTAQLGELAAAAREQGLDALLECHDRDEVERALAFPEALVGANNRDLDSLHVDTSVAATLLRAVPATRIAVAESGYHDAAQCDALRGVADALLVGTALMRGLPAATLSGGGAS